MVSLLIVFLPMFVEGQGLLFSAPIGIHLKERAGSRVGAGGRGCGVGALVAARRRPARSAPSPSLFRLGGCLLDYFFRLHSENAVARVKNVAATRLAIKPGRTLSCGNLGFSGRL